MNLFKELRTRVVQAVEQLASSEGWPQDLPLAAITVELPRDPSHGDMATNAAMVLAKPVGQNPRELAQKISATLTAYLQTEQGEARSVGFGAALAPTEISIAGPGFLNFRFAPSFWQQILPVVLDTGVSFGNSSLGAGQKVNVEYVSANPTGPMHVGHSRGAVVGDALATLLQKAGYSVTKEYYINDAGSQVDTLARSVHRRYREALGEDIGAMPEGMYPGEYLIPAGQALAQELGAEYASAPESEWLGLFKRKAVAAMMEMIREDLALLGIRHDEFASEQELRDSGKVEAAVALLESKGLVYTGVLEPPKGKEPEDWEPRPQTLFRSTDFGDDLDRALKKSDGSWTYFTPDIAYHYNKIERGFDILVDIFGADHGGYVKRMEAAVKALSDGKVTLAIRLCQLVKFLRNGEPAKMSKRAGTFVTAREVVEEVGKDVLRFIMLTRKNDAALDFDFAKVMEQSRENPVFYVQYAHARCRSIIRTLEEKLAAEQGEADFSLLTHSAEIALMQKLALWPVVVEQAATAFEPHRIAFYVQEVAAAFHGFWTLGNENEHLRFIVPDEKLTRARLGLVKAIATVIASGLGVLGVEPVEEMR